MGRRLMILLIIGVGSGCVTTADIDRRLASWHGVDADELATEWGAPYGEYRRKDGSRILSYNSSQILSVGSDTFQRMVTHSCQIDVVVAEDNTVSSLQWRGEIDRCMAMGMPYEGDQKTPGQEKSSEPSPTPQP